MKKLATITLALAGLWALAYAPQASTLLTAVGVLALGFIALLCATLIGRRVNW